MCVCVCVCVYEYMCIPPISFWMAWPILMNHTYHVYKGAWAHLNGVRHKFLPSVIPTLQPLKFVWQNLNFAWTPVPIFMKLGVYILPRDAISTAYLLNSLDQQYQHYILSNCCGNNCNVT
jgi:hypothetical protein